MMSRPQSHFNTRPNTVKPTSNGNGTNGHQTPPEDVENGGGGEGEDGAEQNGNSRVKRPTTSTIRGRNK